MPNTRRNPEWDVILEVIGPAHWFDVPHHDAFKKPRPNKSQHREHREGTQEEEPMKLSLKFSTPPRDGTSWFCIGRDEAADIRIDSKAAVSGRHLYVGFDEWGQIIIRDPSKFGSKVAYTQIPRSMSSGIPRSQQHDSFGNSIDPPQWVVPVGWKVSMMLGQLEARFVFQAPDHSYHIERYQQMVENFRGPQDDLMPFLGGLASDSIATTTRGILPTTKRSAPYTKPGRYAWIIGDRRLGGGSFGHVFEVFNSSNWAMCAGKRVYHYPEFWREYSLMSALDHRHIARYIDKQRLEDAEPMIIMEYCKLGSLADQHRLAKFKEEEIVKIMTQAFSAVEYLHRNNVIHRDLKPENILIRSKNPLEIAVSDFGLSKQGGSSSGLRSTAGSDYYMAPEVLGTNEDPNASESKRAYTNQSDIWSLGVIAIELVHGELPKFNGQHGFGLGYCRRINDDVAGFLSSVQDRDFAYLVSEMLSWDPVDRPTAALCLWRVPELSRDSEDDASERSYDSESGHSENVEAARQGEDEEYDASEESYYSGSDVPEDAGATRQSEDEEDDASARSYDSESGSSDDAQTIRPGEDDEIYASERSYDSESGDSEDFETFGRGEDDEWSHSSSFRRDF